MPTTNMSLNEPSVGTTAGPTWATEVNENFTTIDQHDHTSGKGVQLTPSALNINSDLEFNGNAATELKRLTIDSSATGSGTNYSVYQSGGNLYWYNGSGQAVQITNGANVKTTGGSIDGMGGTDAAVDYGSGIYKFEFDSTKTPFAGAKMSHADINLYKYDGSSGSNAYVILKYTGSSEGSNNITVPDETGTMLTTSTSFGGAISISATGGSGSITLDAAQDINLDSDTGVLTFKDNGTAIGKISNSSSDLVIENEVDAKDIIFKQYDGNEVVRMADDRRLYFFDKGGEYIYGDGSNLYLVAGTSVDFADGNITSIGDLNCDSVSVDDASVGLNIDFGGNTGTNKISLTDNLASALDITESTNSYIKFVTTNSSEQIVFGKNSTFAGTTIADLGSVTTCDINGGTINGITDLAVADGGTGASDAAGARSNLDVVGGLAKTDGNFIVGNGSAWVAESGSTARASLGLAIGSDVFTQRTITGTTNEITVTNGDGVSGNPTISLPSEVNLGDSSKLTTDEVRAFDGAGLKLYDDDGNGIFVEEGGNVGIGTASPVGDLHISESGASEVRFQLTNSSTGQAASDGMTIVLAADGGTSYVWNYDSTDMLFGTNGSTRLTIASGGAVSVAGALSKGSGSFKIDHPLESKSETHNLIHSFIEGPQADLIYRGNVTLVDGGATVNIDTVSNMTEGTFVALNTNTQCFTNNESGWVAVKGSVSGNILTITAQDSASTDTISWMVIGERHDPHMIETDWTDENGKIIVEPLKEITKEITLEGP